MNRYKYIYIYSWTNIYIYIYSWQSLVVTPLDRRLNCILLPRRGQRRSWLLEADAKQNNCSHYFVKQGFATVTLLLLLLFLLFLLFPLPSPTPRHFLAFVLVFTPFTYWRIYARRYKIFTAPLAALLASSRASLLLLPPASTLGTSLTTRNCAGVAFVCRGRRPFATDPTPV